MNSPLNTTDPSDDTGHPLLLDPSALDALLTELDKDEAALDAFLAAFVRHWPERLRRTDESVSAHDPVAVLDCALSIKVSAQMVGAVRLSTCGSGLEDVARSNRLDEAPALLGALRTIGEQTLSALAAARGHDLAA